MCCEKNCYEKACDVYQYTTLDSFSPWLFLDQNTLEQLELGAKVLHKEALRTDCQSSI